MTTDVCIRTIFDTDREVYSPRFRLKILRKIEDGLYEVGDRSGICKMRVPPDFWKMKLIAPERSISVTAPIIHKEERTLELQKEAWIFDYYDVKVPITVLSKFKDLEKVNNEPTIVTQSELQCEGCERTFEENVFLKHVGHNKECKAVYGAERFASMKKERRKKVQKKHVELKYEDKIEAMNKNLTEEEIEEDRAIGWIMTCEGCKVTFQSDVFFRHVPKTEVCKKVYEGRWELMLKAKKNVRQGIKDMNQKEKKKEYYKQNKAAIAEKRKDRYQKKKLDKEEEERQNRVAVRLNWNKEMREKMARKHILVWKKCRDIDLNRFRKSGLLSPEWIEELESIIKDGMKKFGDLIDEAAEKAKDLTDQEEVKIIFDDLMECFQYDGEWRKFQDEADRKFKKYARALGGMKLSCDNCVGRKFKCPKCSEEEELEKPANSEKVCDAETQPETTSKVKKRNIKRKSEKAKSSDEENAENSPKIKKKPLIRKRKKMSITMEDLENAKESDEDEDFVV